MHTLNFLSGVSHSVKNWHCLTSLCWTWGKSRQVLLWCSSIASSVICYQTCCEWQFRLSAGQHTCASGAWYNRTSATWNTSPDWTLLITRFVESCSSVCTRCRSTMSTNTSSDWLTFGAVCSKVLSTLLSATGESVCRRVFTWRVKGGHFKHLL